MRLSEQTFPIYSNSHTSAVTHPLDGCAVIQLFYYGMKCAAVSATSFTVLATFAIALFSDKYSSPFSVIVAFGSIRTDGITLPTLPTT